jgi:hypothetical protein
MALALGLSAAKGGSASGASSRDSSGGASPALAGEAGEAAAKSEFGKFSFDWEGKRCDLSKGLYLIAMLSDTCEHCAQVVGTLNALNERPGMPAVVGLILGEGETLNQFRRNFAPRFPTRLIPVLDFFNLIGDAPPRFHLVRDGRAVKFWDTDPPAANVLQEFPARPAPQRAVR